MSDNDKDISNGFTRIFGSCLAKHIYVLVIIVAAAAVLQDRVTTLKKEGCLKARQNEDVIIKLKADIEHVESDD